MKIDFTGKTAVVFGASRGIGKGIATVLASAGAKVYVSSRTESNCKGLKEELTAQGYHAEYCAAEVSDYEAVDRVKVKAIEETGRLNLRITLPVSQ